MKPPALSEIIFMVAMALVVVMLTAACIYFFMRQYRKEAKEKEAPEKVIGDE
jgi:heme/copper-type cytochrome/quinol oxidase subunit 2